MYILAHALGKMTVRWAIRWANCFPIVVLTPNIQTVSDDKGESSPRKIRVCHASRFCKMNFFTKSQWISPLALAFQPNCSLRVAFDAEYPDLQYYEAV
jgi:hypothetical protein